MEKKKHKSNTDLNGETTLNQAEIFFKAGIERHTICGSVIKWCLLEILSENKQANKFT